MKDDLQELIIDLQNDEVIEEPQDNDTVWMNPYKELSAHRHIPMMPKDIYRDNEVNGTKYRTYNLQLDLAIMKGTFNMSEMKLLKYILEYSYTGWNREWTNPVTYYNVAKETCVSYTNIARAEVKLLNRNIIFVKENENKRQWRINPYYDTWDGMTESYYKWAVTTNSETE